MGVLSASDPIFKNKNEQIAHIHTGKTTHKIYAVYSHQETHTRGEKNHPFAQFDKKMKAVGREGDQ